MVKNLCQTESCTLKFYIQEFMRNWNLTLGYINLDIVLLFNFLSNPNNCLGTKRVSLRFCRISGEALKK